MKNELKPFVKGVQIMSHFMITLEKQIKYLSIYAFGSEQ